MGMGRVKYRRRIHRRVKTMNERIVSAVSSSIGDQTYQAKSLKELRERLAAIVKNDRFWKALDDMAKAAKVVGHIDFSC